MSELLIRAGSDDAALLRRVFGVEGGRPATRRPDRIVVDAHVAVATPELASTANLAGVPFLIDPLTFFLQDRTHPSFAWTRLDYARAEEMTPAQLANSDQAAAIVAGCIRHQLDHGPQL